jgi:hypothetical protein
MKMTNNKLHAGEKFLIKQWPPSFRFADSTQDPEELEYAILRTSDARQVDGLSLPSGVRIRAAVQAKRGLAGGASTVTLSLMPRKGKWPVLSDR